MGHADSPDEWAHDVEFLDDPDETAAHDVQWLKDPDETAAHNVQWLKDPDETAAHNVQWLKDPDETAAHNVQWLKDPDETAAHDVQWLDEEAVGSGSDPAALPPRAARHRVLASLLALGVFLAGTGSAAAAAYQRHVTDRRLANELVLRASASPPAIPDLASLGFAGSWQARVTERVLVPVVNQGSRTVELLDAELVEPGLIAEAKLTPAVGKTLRPGATGELAGTVTADCAAAEATATAVLGSGQDPAATGTGAVLQVRARTSGGTTATVRLNPESTQDEDLQHRICEQEGDHLTGPQTVTTSVDTTSHIIVIRLAAQSNANVRVDYWAQARYETDPGEQGESFVLSTTPGASPSTGALMPGGSLAELFAVGVWRCPSKPPAQPHTLLIQLHYSVGGEEVSEADRAVDLNPLITAACA